MSFLDRAHLNAKALFKAMSEMGTKEDIIIQVLCTASNDEIAELRDAYEHGKCAVLVLSKAVSVKRTLKEFWPT